MVIRVKNNSLVFSVYSSDFVALNHCEATLTEAKL